MKSLSVALGNAAELTIGPDCRIVFVCGCEKFLYKINLDKLG